MVVDCGILQNPSNGHVELRLSGTKEGSTATVHHYIKDCFSNNLITFSTVK